MAETSPTNENLNIHISTGSDFYWNFFNGSVINANEGPVAIETCLGWVSGGCATTDYTTDYSNAVENLLKIATAQVDTTPDLIKENDQCLIELIKNFWKVEDIGIYVEQDSFIKNFENFIEYKNNKYTVKLRWNITFLIISYRQGIDRFLY